jgi:hypothetical protein
MSIFNLAIELFLADRYQPVNDGMTGTPLIDRVLTRWFEISPSVFVSKLNSIIGLHFKDRKRTRFFELF